MFNINKPSTKRIKITEKCNQNCIFCNSEPRFPAVVYSKKNILKLIFDRGNIKRLNMTGGEPTLCRDLDFYVSVARRRGYKQIVLLSNGSRFVDKNYVKRLKKSGLTEVIISVYHYDATLSDAISRKKGSFARKTEGIKNLMAVNIKVTVNIVLFNWNYRLLPEIVNYLNSSFGIKFFAFSFLESNCLNVKKNPELIPDLMSALFFLGKAVKICQTKKLTYYIPFDGAIPPCIFKRYKITVNKPEIIMGTDLQAGTYYEFCKTCEDKRFCLGFSKGYKLKCLEILGYDK
jgi:sulfatase maturation enzyme AslB (radical SAM superfamily)